MKFSSAIVNLVALAAIVGTAESYERNFSVSRRMSKADKGSKATKEPKEPKDTKAPKTDGPTSGPTSGPTAGPTAEPTSMPTMAPEPECAGQLIFMGMTANDLVGSGSLTYFQAFNAAPTGCGLATITSESDRARAFDAKPDLGEYWAESYEHNFSVSRRTSKATKEPKDTKEPKEPKEPKAPKTGVPTSGPTAGPTSEPTSGPTSGPTAEPTSMPTMAPEPECAGQLIFMGMTATNLVGSATMTYVQAVNAAPAGCGLATITSESDRARAFDAKPGFDEYWMGVFEPECAGQLIFMGMTATNLIGSNTMTYIQAVNAAPAGCGLATITSESDRARAFDAKPDLGEYWMGVFKDYDAVVADGVQGSNGVTSDDLRNGWMNLDGSDLYEQGNDSDDTPTGPWKVGDFPSNDTNDVKTNTVWQNQGLRDAAPTQGAAGAIFKCCIPPTRFGQPIEDMMM
eukprot:CAMPEP_0119571880 /NCGR_PEP_ID=MMETSP1352-20130426/44340_1 /TAXON_ID=265584 /ORGANISM="Stauroneis constricta, Strain CCMP1120" /LENGTH=456 /DNA_ID=CAMNT_0007621563 /DNA_START=48 /DNA_END=1419 /DNA_ORIENTATION=+